MKTNELNSIRSEIQKQLDILQPFAMRINRCRIRMMKIDLILNPKFTLTASKELKTNNVYLQAKGYWPDSEGKLKRTISLSLGNMINYPLGTKHPDTIRQAKIEISEILMKKFGNVI